MRVAIWSYNLDTGCWVFDRETTLNDFIADNIDESSPTLHEWMRTLIGGENLMIGGGASPLINIIPNLTKEDIDGSTSKQ